MQEHSYYFQVELNGDSDSGYTERLLEDAYLYRITAKATSVAVAGTVVVRTEATPSAGTKNLLSDVVTTAAPIFIEPYKLVQDAAGADISGEYNQSFIRRGERLQVVGSDLSVAGTVVVGITLSNIPLPSTR